MMMTIKKKKCGGLDPIALDLMKRKKKFTYLAHRYGSLPIVVTRLVGNSEA